MYVYKVENKRPISRYGYKILAWKLALKAYKFKGFEFIMCKRKQRPKKIRVVYHKYDWHYVSTFKN